MSEKRKFIKGLNPLKVKSSGTSKQLTKAKELERKKAAEEETAAVLNEYVAEHQVRTAAKTFVRAGLQHPDKTEENFHVKTEVGDNGAVYKPKSRIQQLAEEFQKSKAVSEDYKASKDLAKKKIGEKKKSNLELFKEELERSQQERDIRRKIKKGDLSGISEETLNALPPTFFKAKVGADDFAYQYGSKDPGDTTTTNLFVSNLNPKMNEEQLCRVFGKYGPLASVKIMWPRTEEEKQKNRNCGFVAFMNRGDGERALADIEGKDVMEYEMKLGWGKAVPIPPIPIYIHPSHSNAVKPPKQSGFPFNCQLPYKIRKEGKEFDGNLENTVVKVVMPTERTILSLINRVVEFVVREGPMFEAMIMNREIQNPLFKFLFDNKSNEHIYYRWRIFSLLQGDTVNKWQTGCFRMFVGGSIWQPPSMNPFHNTGSAASSLATAALLASNSAANVHSSLDPAISLALKKNLLLEQLLKESRDEKDEKEIKKALSDRQRDKLEDLLRTITTDRSKVGELMRWAIDHADNAEEIVECICESLSILETPIPTKVARLYVVNDILHNSSAKVRQASSFRKHFQNNLLDTMEHLHKALSTCSTKSQQEKFRKQVLSCLAAWQDWSLYPPNYLINLQNVFVGISTSENIKAEEESLGNANLKAKLGDEDDIDGNPVDDDIDGIAIYDDELDGIAIGDNDIDGIPLKKDESETLVPKSRWETDDPLSKSRWEQTDIDKSNEIETALPDDKPKFKPGKWEKVEGVKEGRNTDKKDERKRSKSRSPSKGGDDSDRRRFLRDVEVKVMRFVDKLEQKGASRSGLNIQKEAEKFRQQLIDEYDQSRSGKTNSSKSKQKRGRSSSRSPIDSKRRKSSRKRSSSDSDSEFKKSKYQLGDSPTSYSPPSRRRSVSRSPKRRRSISRSPMQRRRSFSRSPRRKSFSRSPRRRNSRSPIFSERSRSPHSIRHSPRRERRSISFSPRRSMSPRYGRPDRSPSPPSYSPRRSGVNKSAKKKKSKKGKK